MEDPYYAEVASFVGSFITAVFLVVAWIVVCKTLPPLRQRLGVTYGIAIALAVLSESIPFLVEIRSRLLSGAYAA